LGSAKLGLPDSTSLVGDAGGEGEGEGDGDAGDVVASARVSVVGDVVIPVLVQVRANPLWGTVTEADMVLWECLFKSKRTQTSGRIAEPKLHVFQSPILCREKKGARKKIVPDTETHGERHGHLSKLQNSPSEL
jgi:hypothetical protein